MPNRHCGNDFETVNWQVTNFARQVPIGKYIVDFVCFEPKVVIEVDGGHHQEQARYDTARTTWLESQGFQVLRFWNHEVLTRRRGCTRGAAWGLAGGFTFSSITLTPSPLPSREREEDEKRK